MEACCTALVNINITNRLSNYYVQSDSLWCLLTTWQGCSDPKTDRYTIKAAVRKEERRQVVYKKKRLMTPPHPIPPHHNLAEQ